ncbi:MAG: queuosine salvage family protein [Trueperaceae bacterium]|nr:MAG: queuosine salvage family protein [Trueperaceae bacterium]
MFETVREACARVAAVADHVRLVGDITLYADRFDPRSVSVPSYDERHHFRGDAEATVAYLLMLDTVNFGSGYFPRLIKRKGMSGYFTVASRLKDVFEARGAPSAQELSELSPEQVTSLLGQDLEDPVRAELMSLYAGALNELGSLLVEKYQGRYAALLEEADHSAGRLVAGLSRLKDFRDIAYYRGFEVPFYKRAQITVSDLALAFGGRGYGFFEDLDQLTMFADNLVPHVLRTDGLLVYGPELATKLARGELVAPGSPEEVEIRAVALHAVEELVRELRGRGLEVSARQIDIALWNRGQEPRYKRLPRHRTRTVFY